MFNLKLTISLFLTLTMSIPALANMDDDFAAPTDFEAEKSAEADLETEFNNLPPALAAELNEDKPIPLPKEPTKKMKSKPMVARQAPIKIEKSKSLKKSKVAQEKSQLNKKKQAQALKKMNGQKRASK